VGVAIALDVSFSSSGAVRSCCESEATHRRARCDERDAGAERDVPTGALLEVVKRCEWRSKVARVFGTYSLGHPLRVESDSTAGWSHRRIGALHKLPRQYVGEALHFFSRPRSVNAKHKPDATNWTLRILQYSFRLSVSFSPSHCICGSPAHHFH